MAVAAGSIPLLGAPDSYIGGPEAKSKPTQVMQLEMNGELLEDLLKSIRSGKPPQILFGSSPMLKYGNNETRILETVPEKFRHELYSAGTDDDEDGIHFEGLLNHRLAIRKAEKASAGMDSALATLKSSLASLSQEKEARSTKIVDSPDFTPLAARRAGKGKKGLLKNSSLLTSARSVSTSPALGATPSPSLIPPTSAPPTSHQLGSETLKALRTPLLHLLAIKPLTLKQIALTTRAKREDCAAILPKIAREGTGDVKEWKLIEKSYKELDVWNFRYPSEDDRQSAIDNAVRAFDKQRLSPDEPIWQKLLPKHERGKGKSLSRLNLNSSAAPPQRTTPLMGPKALGKKKTAAAKKVEAKTAADAKVKDAKPTAKAKKAEGSDKSEEIVDGSNTKPKKGSRGTKGNDDSIEKKAAPSRTIKATVNRREAASPSLQPTSNSTPSSTTPRKTDKGRATNNSNTTTSSKTSTTKATKDKMKQQNTKPKTPSPLNSSISASDFEEDHPVHRQLSASPSPRQKPSHNAPKRSMVDHDDDDDTPLKKRKVVSKPTKSAPAPKTDSKSRVVPSGKDSQRPGDKPLKRKADASATSANAEPVTKQRKLGTAFAPSSRPSNGIVKHTTGHNNSSPAPFPSSSSNDSNSPPFRMSWRQTIRQAQHFREYYARYQKFYTELADSEDPPTEKQRAELLKMHRKLEEMKRELGTQGSGSLGKS